jgi:hypothetical protein
MVYEATAPPVIRFLIAVSTASKSAVMNTPAVWGGAAVVVTRGAAVVVSAEVVLVASVEVIPAVVVSAKVVVSDKAGYLLIGIS